MSKIIKDKASTKKIIQMRLRDAIIKIFEELNGSSNNIKKVVDKDSKRLSKSIHSLLKKETKEKIKKAKKVEKKQAKQSKKVIAI